MGVLSRPLRAGSTQAEILQWTSVGRGPSKALSPLAGFGGIASSPLDRACQAPSAPHQPQGGPRTPAGPVSPADSGGAQRVGDPATSWPSFHSALWSGLGSCPSPGLVSSLRAHFLSSCGCVHLCGFGFGLKRAKARTRVQGEQMRLADEARQDPPPVTLWEGGAEPPVLRAGPST